MFYVVVFFFFKQKTAYEVRISDWSSDVCSSDLGWLGSDRRPRADGRGRVCLYRRSHQGHDPARRREYLHCRSGEYSVRPCRGRRRFGRRTAASHVGRGTRSEEHTSELQSLMRNSYAVFCFKKKNTKYITKQSLSSNT